MVWVGLSISLLTALVASFSELKQPKGVRRWSRAFLFRNRFKFAAAAFAVLGFCASALTVVDDRSKAEEAQAKIRDQNNQLKTLALSEKGGSPIVEIAIFAASQLDSARDFSEEIQWKDTGRPLQPPRALGSFPPPSEGSCLAQSYLTVCLSSSVP